MRCLSVMRRLGVLAYGLVFSLASFAQLTPDAQTCVGTAGTAEERIAACTRAITSGQLSRDNLAVAFYNRGLEWAEKRDYDRAISDYTEAIRINPQYVNAYNNRGNEWNNKRDHDRAIADYTEAIRINPQYSQAFNNRGISWAAKGDRDRAIADYTEAIRINPQYSRAFYNRGVEWTGKRDHDQAIADYTVAIRFNPQYAVAYNNRGIAWRSKGDHDRAIADYTEAIRINPQYAVAYNNRGWAWDAKGEAERATADFNQALQISPKNASYYNSFAWRHAVSRNDKARDGKRAIELARQGCELTSWKDANYLDTLAAAYAEAGQFPEAIRWQEKTLEFPEFVKTNGPVLQERLKLYRAGKPYRE